MNKLLLFAGEDVLAVKCDDSETLHAKAELFRHSGLWEEVVRGMDDLTVKFDPLGMSGEEAEVQFRRLWETPSSKSVLMEDVLTLEASFTEGDGPDVEMVARKLGIQTEELPQWVARRDYRATMMGFQPGFAYLEDLEPADLQTLTRLDTPRQRVAAGSIGFLGGRACIYAFDGPGGWPIIGRVCEPLFRRDSSHPFLIEPGQLLRFKPI